MASNESLQSVTLGDYFGENYNMIPNALSKDETIKEYADAENAFGYYSMDRGMAEILDPNKYAGQKELTVEDFHRDKELTQKWISFDY